MSAVFIRWSGAALALGALLVGVMSALVAIHMLSIEAPWVATLLFIGAICTMLALPGMYARQAKETGWIGLAGHALLATGWLLILYYAANALLNPSAKSIPDTVAASLLALALILGLALTTIATLRAGVYPRWAGFLLLADCIVFPFALFGDLLPTLGSAPLGSLFGVAFGLLFSAAFVWLGLSSWASSTMAV